MLKIFRLITSFWFYVAVIALGILVMLMTKINVKSFRWVSSLNVINNMKQGDNIYISQQKISDYSVLLTYVNITLGHGGGSSQIGANGSDIQGSTIQKSVLITKYLNTLRQTDIVGLQEKNPDGSALSTIITQGNSLIQQGSLLVAPLTLDINKYQGQLDVCIGQKKLADDAYNAALKSYNSVLVEKSTTQAQEASICMSSTSVAMNSAKGVLANLQGEINKNKQYIGLITANKSLLLQYGNILGTQVPVQLVDLQQQIEKL